MRKLTTQEMEEIVSYLQGTCKSLDEGIRDVLDDENIYGVSDIENEMELYSIIDDAIFLCARCGWWCEAGDWIDDEHPDWDPAEETCKDCGGEN